MSVFVCGISFFGGLLLCLQLLEAIFIECSIEVVLASFSLLQIALLLVVRHIEAFFNFQPEGRKIKTTRLCLGQ